MGEEADNFTGDTSLGEERPAVQRSQSQVRGKSLGHVTACECTNERTHSNSGSHLRKFEM